MATRRSRLPSPVKAKTCTVPADCGSGLTIAKALSTFGAKPYNPANISRSNLLNVDRFGE
jgi:hypothetical protein